MKKPRIFNDITNIFAKLAGSDDYDPRVKYDTALEYYANQVPVIPKPVSGDANKVLSVKSDLTYELKSGGATDANAVHYTADTGKTDEQKAQARSNIGALGSADLGTVFTFKGSKATYADLLLEENPQIGDVWFVDADSANYVWIEDEANPDGFWDEFGQPINLSAYEEKPTTSTQAGSSVTIASAVDNTIYECGELSSLTITAIANPGSFIVRFTSGGTATTTNFPATMKFPEAFSAEANMRYEINVSNGYALAVGWPTT